jgi:Rrf2 family protein
MSFGTGLHVMVALAYNPGTRLSSTDLASSIGANPVTVRRVVGELAAAGLVDTQPGPGGGAWLARSASKISLQDIYEALGKPPFIEGHSKEPQAHCVVSVCMPKVFDRLNGVVAEKASPVLKRTSLQSLVDQEID